MFLNLLAVNQRITKHNMLILVDSREQAPLKFSCEIIRKGLKFGDYGCLVDDYQIPVVFERKSLGDLFGSLTFGYDRFKKVFERAKVAEYKLIIVIEGTKERVLEGYSHSARDPASIIKQLETIERKYGITHLFFKTRHQMSVHIEKFFDAAAKEYLDAKIQNTHMC